jgi:hypothetical protein
MWEGSARCHHSAAESLSTASIRRFIAVISSHIVIFSGEVERFGVRPDRLKADTSHAVIRRKECQETTGETRRAAPRPHRTGARAECLTSGRSRGNGPLACSLYKATQRPKENLLRLHQGRRCERPSSCAVAGDDVGRVF